MAARSATRKAYRSQSDDRRCFPSSAWNLLDSQRKPERVGRLQVSDRSRLLLLEAVMRISTLIAAGAGSITGAMALLAAPCALALSLGNAAPQSSLGQPLRVIVPIDASKAASLTVACVHVIADAWAAMGHRVS